MIEPAPSLEDSRCNERVTDLNKREIKRCHQILCCKVESASASVSVSEAESDLSFCTRLRQDLESL